MSVIASETSSSYRADETQLMLVDNITTSFIFRHSYAAFGTQFCMSVTYLFATMQLIAFYPLYYVNVSLYMLQLFQLLIRPIANAFSSANFHYIQIFLDLNQPAAACAQFTYFLSFKTAAVLIVIVALALCRLYIRYFFLRIAADDGTLDKSILTVILTSLLTFASSGEISMLFQVYGKELLFLLFNLFKTIILLVILAVTQAFEAQTATRSVYSTPISIFAICISIVNCLALCGVIRGLKFLNFAKNKIYFRFKFMFPFRVRVLGVACARFAENIIDCADYNIVLFALMLLRVLRSSVDQSDYLMQFQTIAQVFMFEMTAIPARCYCRFLAYFIGLNMNLGLTQRIKKLVFDKCYVYFGVCCIFCVFLRIISGSATRWLAAAIQGQAGFSGVEVSEIYYIIKPLNHTALLGILYFPWCVSMRFNKCFGSFGNKIYIAYYLSGFALEVGIALLFGLLRNRDMNSALLSLCIGKFILSFSFIHFGQYALVKAKLIDFRELDDQFASQSPHLKEGTSAAKGPQRNDSSTSGPSAPRVQVAAAKKPTVPVASSGLTVKVVIPHEKSVSSTESEVEQSNSPKRAGNDLHLHRKGAKVMEGNAAPYTGMNAPDTHSAPDLLKINDSRDFPHRTNNEPYTLDD